MVLFCGHRTRPIAAIGTAALGSYSLPKEQIAIQVGSVANQSSGLLQALFVLVKAATSELDISRYTQGDSQE